MFRQLEPGFMSKIFKKREAKLGGELAETKVILKEYKEKAEKWDRLVAEDPDASIILGDELMKACEELDELRTKLEAIQEIIKIPDVWSHPDPIKAIRELLETSVDNQEVGSK